ncbi:MAG: hypothetical protein D6704_05510 [Nitrospirae bacterium]|nr:MAG: hypothetical protein D6704_05510 [Nitrospirota bacterium]
MDISIGSNLLRNTNGVFVAQGQDLIKVEFDEPTQAILLTMDLYTPAGTLVAKLERNQWISNEQDRFELKADSRSLTLIDNTLKSVVIVFQYEGPGRLAVPQAKFYLPGGRVSEVTSERWHVGHKMELKGADVDLCGGGIEIE